MAGEGPAPLDALKGDLPVIGAIPYDKAVLDGSMRGTTVFELPSDSPAFAAVGDCLSTLEGIPR
jgi:CO dehydrogenase nickel-insertion accessory protein CooC1